MLEWEDTPVSSYEGIVMLFVLGAWEGQMSSSAPVRLESAGFRNRPNPLTTFRGKYEPTRLCAASCFNPI